MERISRHVGKRSAAPRKALGTEGSRLQFGPELPTLKHVCAELVLEAMRRTGGNQAMAASMLGVSRQALNKRLNKLRQSGAFDA